MNKMRSWSLVSSVLAISVAGAQSGPQLRSNFSNVVNYRESSKVLKLDKQQLAILKKNMFLVTAADQIQPYHVLAANDYKNFPSIVTTDNLLQLYHVYFDSNLRHAEEHHLLFDTKRLSSVMLKRSLVELSAASDSKVRSAAEANVAYFGVSDRLLGGNTQLPKQIQNRVDNELALINAASGPGASHVVPYDLDYSQFIVRGHYSRSEDLKQYFRVMMWFGSVPFSVEMRNHTVTTPTMSSVRQAALMVSDLYASHAIDAWNRIYRISSLFAGGSNSLTPSGLIPWLKPTVGWPVQLSRVADDKSIVALAKAMKRTTKPAISTKNDRDTVAGDVQFRLMGQRAIPDSIIFNQLTDIYKRPWPSPLDAMAVFGSNRAANILDRNSHQYNPEGWSKYRPTRQKLTNQFADWSASKWNENLYNQSLNLLRLNLAEPSSSMPRFMHSPAWSDKSLASSLAFWAELRHDTLLYGLQTGAEMGDGEEQPFVKGYVEPNIKLYRQVAASLKQMRSGLRSASYLSGDELYEFDAFLDLLGFLQSVSYRELHGGKLTKDEHWRIRQLEGSISRITNRIQLIGEKYDTLNEDDEDMAVVADVHTARGQALTVAVGHADDLIAVVPIEGKLYLARGGVLSYYEFKVPIAGRLTDHVWKSRVRAHELPPRPTWMQSYFVNRSSRAPER